MDFATLTPSTFTLQDGTGAPVEGRVVYANNQSVFTPTGWLAYSTTYRAMVPTRATDATGNPLLSPVVWSFTTTALPPPYTDPVTGMEFVWVDGGTFQMGDTFGDCNSCGTSSYEQPVHEVTLPRGYYLGKTEVTQGQWQAVTGTNPSNFQPPNGYASCPTCPVEWVSWNDIQMFLTTLNASTGKGYRLPTEAKWEYAAAFDSAQAPATKQKYAGRSDTAALVDYAWYGDNSGSQTHPAGGKLVLQTVSPSAIRILRQPVSFSRHSGESRKPGPREPGPRLAPG